MGFIFFVLMLAAALLAGARHKRIDKSQSPLSDDLEEHLCRAIDVWHRAHRDVTVKEILWALERIKHLLTEAMKRCEGGTL